VIQLPSPTAGTASPLDGIVRVATAVACARAGSAKAAQVPTKPPTNARLQTGLVAIARL